MARIIIKKSRGTYFTDSHKAAQFYRCMSVQFYRCTLMVIIKITGETVEEEEGEEGGKHKGTRV